MFKSLGPLEELILNCRDIRPYLTPFLYLTEFRNFERPFVSPPSRSSQSHTHCISLARRARRLRGIRNVTTCAGGAFHTFDGLHGGYSGGAGGEAEAMGR